MKTFITLSFSIFIIMVSCSDKKVDTESYNKEQKRRAVKHISEGEINQYAYKRGKEIANNFTPRFQSLLNKRDTTIEYIYNQFKSTLERAKDSFKVIKNFRLYPIPPDSNINYQQEKALWDAYKYNMRNKIKNEDNLQSVKDSLFIYTRPLLVENDTTNTLKGMWSIILRKKALIIEMPDK